jgi:hypothetical protein
VAADDQVPADEPKPAAPRPVIATDAKPRMASEATENRITKFNAAGTPVDSNVSEVNGNVFMPVNGRLYMWPDSSGSYLGSNGISLTLFGQGGTINLSNADTVVNGWGATALTVKGSGSTSATAALNVKNSSSSSLMYVGNDGRVGFGTSSPTGLFHVYGTATSDVFMGFGPDTAAGPSFNVGYAGGSFGRSVGFMNVRPDASATAPNPSLRFLTANVERMIINNVGNVGIGTTNATEKVHVYQDVDANTSVTVENPNAGLAAAGLVRVKSNAATCNFEAHGSGRTLSRFGVVLGGWNEFLSWEGNGFLLGTSNTAPLIIGTNNLDRIHILADGKVGINTTNPTATLEVNGTIKATSVIGAVYQDVAEWVPATNKMEPGTVVVLNRQRKNEVMPSVKAYDTAVAGVVSAQPGLLLGVESDSKARIATTGRVKVRVDATDGPIEVGDLLVTSDKSGMAMKSKPFDFGGISIHRPGTLIGKALEPIEGGEGEILVLLSLQ